MSYLTNCPHCSRFYDETSAVRSLDPQRQCFDCYIINSQPARALSALDIEEIVVHRPASQLRPA